MQLRVFSGRTVNEAMTALRHALGEDAVILATEEAPDGVTVTAGIEVPADPLAEILGASTPVEIVEHLALALRFHQAGGRRIERLCLTARDCGAAAAVDVLAFALAAHCRFAPLGRRLARPLLLAGGPGAGKTLMVARLAAAARLAGGTVRVASTDAARQGGMAQLAGLVEPLGVTVEPLPPAGGLSSGAPDAAVLLIDTAAVNPLDSRSMTVTADLARRLDAELLPVLAADLAPVEAHEQAIAWRALGATRFLAARLDAARRLGMLLAVADAGLAFAGVGISPLVAEPVKSLAAASLARLLLHRADALAPEGKR